MTASVVISGDLSGREAARGTPTSRPCGAAPHLKFIEHRGRGTFAVSAIYPAEDFAPVRASGVLGTIETETIPGRIVSPVARFPSAAWILIGSVIPAASSLGRCIAGARCVFARPRLSYFSRPFGLPGSPLQRIAIQLRQKSFRSCAQAFHFVLSAGMAGLAACVGRTPTSQKETRKCPIKQWRNPT